MQKILESHEATGQEFSTPGGVSLIQLENHAGGEWQLESKKFSGDGWVQDQMTFDDNGLKAWHTSSKLTYRLTGGSMGAEAYLFSTLYVGKKG